MNKFENVQFDFGTFRTTGRLANTQFAAALHTIRTRHNLSRENLAKSAAIGIKTLYLIEETKTHAQISGMCGLQMRWTIRHASVQEKRFRRDLFCAMHSIAN